MPAPRPHQRPVAPGRNGNGRGPGAGRTINFEDTNGRGPDVGSAVFSQRGRGRSNAARVRPASGPRPLPFPPAGVGGRATAHVRRCGRLHHARGGRAEPTLCICPALEWI
eukprot:gene7445-biopygen9082